VTARRLSYLLVFSALAGATALAVNRIVQPRLAGELLVVVGLALVVGLPGFVHRRLAPLSLLLLPLGAYLLARMALPLPPLVQGASMEGAFYADQIRDGILAYSQDIFPLSLAGVPGLRLVVLLLVYGTAAVSAMLALGARRLLPGMALLLVLLGFALTVGPRQGSTRLALFFLLLVVLALLASQGVRRSRWGMADIVGGLALGAAGIALGAGLLAPGLAADGWQDWRRWDLFSQSTATQTVFNWNQNYPRLLDPANDYPIMRVTSAKPSYWRANTLEVFTGDAWLSSMSFFRALPPGAGTHAVPQPEPAPPGERVVQRFELTGVVSSYLFTGGYAEELTLNAPLTIHTSDSGALRAESSLRPPLAYGVTTLIPSVRPADLVDRGRDYPEQVLRGGYLDLPLPTAAAVQQRRAGGGAWQDFVRQQGAEEFLPLYDLNDRIVGTATDPYEQVLRIERFLRSETFIYSLQPPESPLRSPYAAFLFDTHTGYCQHFAGAMALLARVNGIPARVAVGFVTGRRSGDQSYVVSTNNAHAWVEVYFPGVGWLPFDPTPGRAVPVAGGSSTSPGFTDPFPGSPVAPAVPTTTPSSAPEPPQGAGMDEGADPGSATGGGPGRPTALWLLLIGPLLGWPRVRRAGRELPLRRGDSAGRLRASLRLLRADLREWGFTLGPGATLEELARAVRSEAGIDLSADLQRAQAVLFGGREPRPGDAQAVQRRRRQLERVLRRRRGWGWTLAVWYGVGGLARYRHQRRAARTKQAHWQLGRR